MNFSSILIVTYGRSGSTLLQGILNSIDGCLIRGENYNFCYGLFESYEAIFNSKHQFGKSKSLEVTSPWYGAALLDEKRFLEDARTLVFNQLNPRAKPVSCIGFKEIRYLHINLGAKKLHNYLSFLKKLFPNPAFVFLTRDHSQVVNSAWWQSKDSKHVEESLKAFEQEIKIYSDGKSNAFSIDYQDMVERTQNLRSLFSFLGAEYDEDKINQVLSVRHSTEPKKVKPKEKLISQIMPHQLVKYARLDKLPTKHFGHVTVTGVALIADTVSQQPNLVVINSGREFKVDWLRSAGIKEKFPKDCYAINSRFKIEGLTITKGNSVEIYLEDDGSNQRSLLFKIEHS